ncbi:MAG: hypothetical protein JO265_00425, partial [Acidimicrobiia bacterium]|nr:hypothetical protein [Acidimicrobiia bacterium]
MSDDQGSDAQGSDAQGGEREPDDSVGSAWPVKGPATPQQAIVAIGFVFFLGVLIGFLLCRT